MSLLVSKRNAIDEEIQSIEYEIGQLEFTKLDLQHRAADLKKHRNATVPIARIPPELLVKIFVDSLTRVSNENLAELPGETKSMLVRSSSDGTDVEATCPERKTTSDRLLRPSIFDLYHVSQEWRTVTSGFRELWSHIQVQLGTAPDLVKLMWKNAGDALIRLDVTCTPRDVLRPDEDLLILPVLKELLARHLGRVQSVKIFCRAESLLSVIGEQAEHLETLVAVENHRDRHFIASPHLLGGRSPNLRRLELAGITIPWTSPVITLQLTHLLVDINNMQTTPGTMAELASLLRRLNRLRAFKVYFDYPVADDGIEFYLSSISDRSPIPLPELEALDVHSSHRGPLAAFLSLVHVPKDIPRLAATCASIDHDSAERILNFAICERMPEDFIAPEEVEVGFYGAACWRERRFQWVNNDSRGNAFDTLIKIPKLPWQEIMITRQPEVFPTAHRLPWSFENLRVISIVCDRVPREIWQRLSSVRSLEVVNVYGLEQQDFVTAVQTISLSEAPPVAGPIPSPSWPQSVEEAPQGPSPFPALRAIGFTRFHWDIKHAARVAAVPIENATEAFLGNLAQALMSWGGNLKELRFGNCKDIELDISWLGQLMSRVDCIVWQGRVFLPDAETGKAQEV